ncbi:MAG: D-alanyl-D-alanine carboxypeptidase family protein [Pseudomonadota bacterium]
MMNVSALSFDLIKIQRRVLVLVSVAVLVLSGCVSTDDVMVDLAVPTSNADKYAAIVVDSRSGKVLHSVAANEARYPASLTKMMTVYMMFDAIKAGNMSLDTPIPISAYAAGRPASKLYMKAGTTITADKAIRALVVKSANDVATAVAEHLGGSEEQFARQMTAKGRSLGLTSTVFKNASGLPDPQMLTTARDMAKLAIALRRNHGRYYGYFGLTQFEHNGRAITGHNRVLKSYSGADGLKTGYTRASGYNLATSASRGGRRVVAIVMGGDSGAARDQHMIRLLDKNL